jgi:Zn-dependent peptidase ImmA (M78 family)
MQAITTNGDSDSGRSVLVSLRRLVPERPLEFAEALRVAELQAVRLRELSDVAEDAMPEAVVSELPRISVVRRQLPTSGMSYWNGRCWIIALNSSEPEARQRFTLFHEYKHIIDHGRTDQLYTGTRSHTADEQAEQAADYFAGCVLMPKRLLKRAWGNGVQNTTRLAALFDVSPRAVEVRLAQIGLSDPVERCSPPRRSGPRRPRRYFRAAHAGFALAVGIPA